jgi:hypothetical protein
LGFAHFFSPLDQHGDHFRRFKRAVLVREETKSALYISGRRFIL